jgi:hypothetical protein
MSSARLALSRINTKPATTTPRIATPTKATVASAAVLSPVIASRKTATIGKVRFRNWFQRPVSVIARATLFDEKPQLRRMPYDPATPAAIPPGMTIERAVEAWVTVNACRKVSPGRATIHGGANVTRLTAVAPSRARIRGHERRRTTSQTSP